MVYDLIFVGFYWGDFMRLKIFGTAAAEGIPGLFCSCRVCEKSRELGGKNIRTRSQALINDDLLIDFSPDTYFHVLNYGLDLRPVKACIITHGHDDHLYPYDFQYRIHGYAYFKDEENKKPLRVLATKNSATEIKKVFEEDNHSDKNAVRLEIIEKFTTCDVEGYKITALSADHAKKLDPVIYIIQKDGKSILWAHDTGYFLPETWEYIENSGIVFDFVSLDCTCILNENAYGNHMGLKACCDVKERLLKKNADDKTKFVINHFSHNGGLCHDDLVPVATEMGFQVSFDGIEFEI